MAEEEMVRTAVISEDGVYRYRLDRTWDPAQPVLRYIMLNPSTADDVADDPTIRKCIGFARHNGFGGFRAYNLFALRATRPEALQHAPDPVGSLNDYYLLEACVPDDPDPVAEVVLAWGRNDFARRSGRVDQVMAMLQAQQAVLLRCIGLNADGSPVHPLMPAYRPLVPYVA